ncbi:MAG: amino acid adenylation domain-containing protein [Pleurocapsa minor HA4230-MV1]|jgi:amino acid adenylation domain-containing protein/non-ribosomal peptide synthase protein (TIGR01720 family)|nr:amino acid adenylation domain-containing protein [Pleurocapsa minor HA4230-MV1]
MESLTITGFEISPQQKNLWLSCLAKERQVYRVTGTILIEGNLEQIILEKAIEKVIQNNEILRTGFQAIAGLTVPVQIICNRDNFDLKYYDLINYEITDRQDKLETIIFELNQTEFDLEQGIVFYASLIKLEREKNILAIAISALCADAVSFHNLVQEISQAYQNYLAAKEIDHESLQYADLAAWQNELLAAPEAEVGQQYWQAKNLSDLVINKLPREKQVDGQLEFIPRFIELNLNLNLVNDIKQLAEKYDTSVATLLMTCWQILLWRLSEDKQITIATCFDNRNYQELERVVGLLAKYIPLNIKLEEDITFSQVLDIVAQEIEEIKQWQEYFSGTPNHLSLPFTFEFNSQINKYQLNYLTFTIQNLSACIDRFKVKLACYSYAESLSIQLHYDASLFNQEDIQCLGWEFKTLLESVLDNPKTAIDKLNILSPQEREQLLIKFNQTEPLIPPHQCLHHWFEAQVNKTPNAIAVIFEDEQLTYQELNNQADRIANHLRSLGVKPETIIALCVERSLAIVTGILGILKAGAAYLPLEPNLPSEALKFRLQDAQVSLVLTQKHLQEKIELDVATTQNKIPIISLDQDLQSTPKPSNLYPPKANNLAYVIYTSGSTGKPKGVAIEHRQIVNYLSGVLAKLNIPEAASFATVSTFAADLGNTSIFGALCTGGCLHIVAESKTSDPLALADYFNQHQIDCLKIVPSHLSALLTSANAEKLLPRQRLILGGEASSWELVDKVHKLAPDCQIFNHYGPTETTVGVLIHQIDPIKANSRLSWRANSRLPLLGNPLPNTQIYILDRHQQPMPIGVPGEIYIGGSNVARGYINQPELTAEKFISIPPTHGRRFKSGNPPNALPPLSKGGLRGDRLYKTGDKAQYLQNGKIEFLGRIDNQIKLHGYRIELEEIETVVRQHPQVRDAVVIVKENLSHKYLVAYFVSESEISQELPIFLSNKLPQYMLPSHFIKLKALPLTSNGKIDRNSLPSPETINSQSSAFVAPLNPVETALAKIWAELLGQEKVGIYDNFFELGGDSIISIQAIAKANQIGLRLTPKQIFEHQTIAQLAQVVQVNHSLAEQGLIKGLVPLTPIQHSFFEQNLPEPHHWNQSILLELKQKIEPKQLEEVIKHLLQHHDVLRLRSVGFAQSHFNQQAEVWQSEITESLPEISLNIIDFSDLAEDKQKTAIAKKATQIQSSLNLSAGKLIEIGLFNLGKNQPKRLLIVIHHLIIDGVSWRILLEDLQTALTQINQGKVIQLPAKTTSFKQWAEGLPEYAQTAKVKAELDYWCCESRQKIKPLPVDNADGINTESFARTVSVSLSARETQTLLQKLPAAYHTQVNDILLAALAKAFTQWTGEFQLLINLEGHGREDIFAEVNLSRTIGWFTTIFPVLLDIKKANSNDEVIKTIKEQLSRIPNRGIGYGVLRYLSQDRAISQALITMPQAEICFNYLGQFDRTLANSDWFKLASESDGINRSLLGKRRYLFNINSYILDNKLKLDWIYSSQIHREETVLSLAESYIETLKDFMHQKSSKRTEFTSSDFPQANLNQQQLDQFLATLD